MATRPHNRGTDPRRRGTWDSSEFLGDGRLEKIGLVNGVLLHAGAYWIHRRKESIVVMDETAVQRTVSVDFTLPEVLEGQRFDAVIQSPDKGEPVFCPPLFVLPKASNELMSFDLKSESGVSLPLMTRRDNARVSGATLQALGEIVLGEPLLPGLARRLHNVATANTVRPVAAERLMQAHADDRDAAQLVPLSEDPMFRWWLWTLAHSSLVGVPYRDPTVRRKIFALSYIESFEPLLRVRTPTRLGWTPYNVAIDSSWIGARNFHFEAEAPPGLRIAKAVLVRDENDASATDANANGADTAADAGEHDDAAEQTTMENEVPTLGQEWDGEGEEPIFAGLPGAAIALDEEFDDDPDREVNGLLRRVHLSRYGASRAGATTATFDLRVHGPGFVGGAVLACGLVLAAVALCLLRAESIAKNASSAPAALLLLPGVIATYVGRPDRHALTTRLLLFARWLLLLAGLTAYGCAAFVALGGGRPSTQSSLEHRVEHLELIFKVGFAVAAISFVGLALGWLLANPTVRRRLHGLVRFSWITGARSAFARSSFAHCVLLPLSQEALCAEVEMEKSSLLNLKEGRQRRSSGSTVEELIFYRVDLTSTWTLHLRVSEADDETKLQLEGTCLPRLLLWPVRPLLLRRESRAAGRRLGTYADSVKCMPTHPRAAALDATRR